MRADRLVATTLYLQRHGRTTAAELAEHLEVSVATARRDLEALSAAGVPVYPQPGRGGGWQLVGGARTDLTGLNGPEVRALFAAIGASGDGGAQASSALAKLVRALPAPFRDEATAAASAVRIEHGDWEGRGAARGGSGTAEERLREAIVRLHPCRIDYDRGGKTRRIVVEPWRIVRKAGVAYLLAGTGRGARTYRVDRIAAVEVDTGRAVTRPDDDALEQQWQRTVATVAAARTGVRARVAADEAALAVLADLFGTAFERTDVPGEAIVGAHTERGLAEQLAGWGSRVQLLDAPGVVAELRTIGAELVAL